MPHSLPVVRIQRHCLQDGPGIRTTVFLQGCALACPWCANPEAIPLTPPLFFDESNCIASTRPNSPLCGECPFPNSATPPPACALGAVHPASLQMELETLRLHLLKDAALYRDSGGGVTFSGGEPFLHAQFLVSLLQQLRQDRISIAVETSGYFPPENAAPLLPFLDHVLLDLKILSPPTFNQEVSLPPDAFEQNLRAISIAEAHLTYRLLLIHEFLDTPEKQETLITRLESLPPAPLELLPLHSLAEPKYRQLRIPFTPLSAPTPSDCKSLRDHLEQRIHVPVRLLSL